MVDFTSECEGSKWSLSGLRYHLESQGLGPGWGLLWRQVCDIVAAAVIAAEPRMNTEFKMKVPHRNNCFEVRAFVCTETEMAPEGARVRVSCWQGPSEWWLAGWLVGACMVCVLYGN